MKRVKAIFQFSLSNDRVIEEHAQVPGHYKYKHIFPILVKMSIMIFLLYVDDEPALLDLCKIFLEKTGDFTVTTRSSAVGAADLLEVEPFDAIICDYQMPEKDGLVFLQEVRNNHPEIPFILFTGRGREEIAVRAFELGADFYLQKGGDPKAQFAELTQKIERQLNAMAANIPGVIYRYYVNPDGSTGFDYISERSWQVLGIENNPDTFFNQCLECIIPEDRERFITSNQHAIISKSTWEYEGWLLKPTGKKIWVSAVSSPVMENDRLIFDGVIFDNTARKEAEEALAQSESYYRALFKYTESATIIIEEDTTVSLANDAFAQLFGSSREFIEGKIKWTHFVAPEDRDGMVDYHYRRRKSPAEAPTLYEFRFITADGRTRDMLAHVGMIPGTKKSVASLLDITERKRAQEGFIRAKKDWETIFQATGSPAVILSPDRRIIAANNAVLRKTGKSSEEVIGRLCFEIFHGAAVKGPPDGCPFEKMLASCVHEAREMEVEIFGGVYLVSCTPVFDESGKLERIIHIATDITRLKLAEEQLRRKNDELQASYEQIAATDEEIRGQFDMLSASERTIRESEIKFRSVVESVPVGMHFYDLRKDGQLVLTWANPAADSILGISHLPLLGKTIEEAFPALAGTDIPRHYLSAARDQVSWHTESVDYKDEKISGAFAVWAFPTLPDSMVAAFHDITDRKRTEQHLIESMERYRNVVEDQTEFISRFLPDGTHIFVNEAYCRYFGVKREEIIGSRFRPEIDPRDRERVGQLIASLTPENPVAGIEQRTFMPDGSTRWQKWSDRAIFDKQGRVMEYQSVGRDITDMKTVEKALQQSEATYRQLEAQLPDYVLIHENETIVFVNAEGARLMGKSQEEIIGTSVLSYAAREYHDLVRKNMLLRQQDIPVEPYEIAIIAPSGERRWVEVRAKPILNRDIPAILTVLTDITDRKRAEEALIESEAKYRKIIENMQDLVYQTDLEGRLVMISPSGARLAGYESPDELIGHNIGLELYADPVEREKFLEALKEKGSVTDYPLALKDHNGAIHYVTASSHIYYNKNGEPLGVEGVLHDITDRKRAEESFLQAKHKLHLLSGITRHDINNQMTVLMGYLDLLKTRQFDPESDNYIKNLIIAAERIVSMIRFASEYEEIGVEAPLWQDVQVIISVAAKETPLGEVKLENNLPAGTEIFADPLILRVFYNLMDNAVRYGGKITTIRFSADYHGTDLVIRCEDDGIGIPEEEKEKIFERGFGQTHGLGLALSREILAITGIRIEETGESGVGARFEIVVPKGMYKKADSPQ
ncbi:MAG: PAS domain S-box protein [Methanoregulaceae archaeon]|nr:PAS domain S-box protein [Methanoregulaceae archaeon]